ncbi:laminin subunit beta-3 [Astyanax mexicanus]|uniref:laminin subunit beta-3 n=1 Tax=Astyanax mexicanus TaxID=7994 RepID=UPI0020CABE0D|nr:laminin subunit beta-3 [Astyanax mexicanus]
MKTWAFLQLAALAAVCVAQQDCSRGACYPQLGDLLIGREQHLSASSTCGLLATEIYCTPFGQMRMKCCPCDSQNPAGPNAHTIQNVLSSAGTGRWWQSKKDMNPVTVQVDLQQLFQVNNVMLSFKGPRPDALVIERTKDFGRTWQPALYMAANCASAFPRVSTATPNNLGHTYCYTLPPTSNNPYQDQLINYIPLHQYSNINYPPEYKIQEVSGFTGLRVNLTRLGEVVRLPGRSPSRYYALKEMRVTGSCFCYGHANRCLPDPTSNYLPTVQVNGVCDCQHNTAGVNCERCADFYNDLPWRAAQQDNPHTCKCCECNNHSQKCHFDAELYELSGRSSGGVCDGCLHNTAGPHCERCAPNYYRNPNSDIRQANACLPCQCNSAGSVSGGQCNPATGVCVCKANVEGPRCDRCKPGYYGLNPSNPLGCSKCSCSASGSLSSVCDAVTGQCVCRPNMQGVSCDRCAAGFWNSPTGCQPCNCDPNHSLSSTCDQETGQCVCRSGFMGRTCGGCPDNTYGDPLTGCRPCRCDSTGSAPGGCDKRTGACICKPGVGGARCDSCARGYCSSFPQCPVCPSCFFSLDLQLQNLTLDLDRLAARLDTQPGTGTGTGTGTSGPGLPGDAEDRIRNMEDTLQQIKSFLNLPLPSEPLLTRDLNTLRTLQLTVTRLNNRLYSADPTPDLQGELDKLQALLFNIRFLFDTKRNATTSSGNDYTGSMRLINFARERSVAAEKQANATGNTINNSATIRGDALKDLDNIQPGNTDNLQKLKDNLATRPNLTPTAVQVCGSTRLTPCTPQECNGELCPPAGAPPCGQSEPCTGALPQANRAVKNTDEVKTKLQQLNKNITQAYEQIQETQNSADRVRLSAEELANRIKVTRDDLDYDLKDIKDFIKKLKDFLSDPSSDPAEVQRVCEAVLGVKLPEGAESLRKKLQEMQDLAATLPDSTRVLKEAEPKLEQARRLLQDAERTRNKSVLLQNGADQLISDLNKSEDDLEKLQNNLEQSQDIVNKVKDDIQKVDQSLAPVDQLLTDVGLLLQPMRPLLEELKGDVKKAREETGEAEKQAGGAELEAELAATELEELQEQLKKLKQNANASTDANEAQQRLLDLHQDGIELIQETRDMMQKIMDKERSLQEGKEELQRSSERLAGLDVYLQELINEIHSRATKLNMCQF